MNENPAGPMPFGLPAELAQEYERFAEQRQTTPEKLAREACEAYLAILRAGLCVKPAGSRARPPAADAAQSVSATDPNRYRAEPEAVSKGVHG
jgi:hypothetical protein